MPSDDAFLAMICEHYTEAAPKLVYADWLEEQGRCDEAAAWRWLGAEGKYPHRTKFYHFASGWPTTDVWRWYTGHHLQQGVRLAHILPESVFRRLPFLSVDEEANLKKVFLATVATIVKEASHAETA